MDPSCQGLALYAYDAELRNDDRAAIWVDKQMVGDPDCEPRSPVAVVGISSVATYISRDTLSLIMGRHEVTAVTVPTRAAGTNWLPKGAALAAARLVADKNVSAEGFRRLAKKVGLSAKGLVEALRDPIADLRVSEGSGCAFTLLRPEKSMLGGGALELFAEDAEGCIYRCSSDDLLVGALCGRALALHGNHLVLASDNVWDRRVPEPSRVIGDTASTIDRITGRMLTNDDVMCKFTEPPGREAAGSYSVAPRSISN